MAQLTGPYALQNTSASGMSTMPVQRTNMKLHAAVMPQTSTGTTSNQAGADEYIQNLVKQYNSAPLNSTTTNSTSTPTSTTGTTTTAATTTDPSQSATGTAVSDLTSTITNNAGNWINRDMKWAADNATDAQGRIKNTNTLIDTTNKNIQNEIGGMENNKTGYNTSDSTIQKGINVAQPYFDRAGNLINTGSGQINDASGYIDSATPWMNKAGNALGKVDSDLDAAAGYADQSGANAEKATNVTDYWDKQTQNTNELYNNLNANPGAANPLASYMNQETTRQLSSGVGNALGSMGSSGVINSSAMNRGLSDLNQAAADSYNRNFLDAFNGYASSLQGQMGAQSNALNAAAGAYNDTAATWNNAANTMLGSANARNTQAGQYNSIAGTAIDQANSKINQGSANINAGTGMAGVGSAAGNLYLDAATGQARNAEGRQAIDSAQASLYQAFQSGNMAQANNLYNQIAQGWNNAWGPMPTLLEFMVAMQNAYAQTGGIETPIVTG